MTRMLMPLPVLETSQSDSKIGSPSFISLIPASREPQIPQQVPKQVFPDHKMIGPISAKLGSDWNEVFKPESNLYKTYYADMNKKGSEKLLMKHLNLVIGLKGMWMKGYLFER